MKQSKQGAPYWHVSLVNVCRMVNSLMNSLSWREQEEYNPEEELWERLASLPEPLDKLLDLQQICRVLQPREVRDTNIWMHAYIHTYTGTHRKGCTHRHLQKQMLMHGVQFSHLNRKSVMQTYTFQVSHTNTNTVNTHRDKHSRA